MCRDGTRLDLWRRGKKELWVVLTRDTFRIVSRRKFGYVQDLVLL